MEIKYKETKDIEKSELEYLYNSVNWTSYAKDMSKLIKGIKRSLYVVSAWDGSKLAGLIRVVGDGQTIVYVQDIIVLEEYQSNGIGSELLKLVLAKYQNVRQKVLLTNESASVRAFYEKHGFFSCDQGDLVAFAYMN